MITRAQIEKLGALHAVEPTMLSLYLAVPPPADLACPGRRAHRRGRGGLRPADGGAGPGLGAGEAATVRP